MTFLLGSLTLFAITAVAEIVGCYLPDHWLRKDGSIWLLVPAAGSLAAFTCLVSLHPAASGRLYAAYGRVSSSVAILWLWLVDGIRPIVSDLLGVVPCLSGMAITMTGRCDH